MALISNIIPGLVDGLVAPQLSYSIEACLGCFIGPKRLRGGKICEAAQGWLIGRWVYEKGSPSANADFTHEGVILHILAPQMTIAEARLDPYAVYRSTGKKRECLCRVGPGNLYTFYALTTTSFPRSETVFLVFHCFLQLQRFLRFS